MALKGEIADSDDEDNDLELPVVDLLTHDSNSTAATTHNSGSSTDPSFFANVYAEHQAVSSPFVSRVQRAKANSGDVPLPTKVYSRREVTGQNASSTTNVTSPAVQLTKVRDSQRGQLSMASEVTTPQKSTRVPRDVWDLPESDDEISAPADRPVRETRSSSAKKRRVAPGSSDTGPLTKRTRLTSSPAPSGSRKLGKIYVANSRLSSSEKREYKRVEFASDDAAGGTVVPSSTNLPPEKSSGATTIAYPTPSNYASSRPPLPWEEDPSEIAIFHEAHAGVKPVSSSPDELATVRSRKKKRISTTTRLSESGGRVDDEDELSSRPSMRDRKSKAEDDYDDELGHDSDYESNNKRDPQPATGRSSRSLRRKAAAASVSEGRDEPGEIPAPSAVATDSPTFGLTKEKRKRGRPKKSQSVVEEAIPEGQDMISEADSETLLRREEDQEPPVKRKRGRPRKSDVTSQPSTKQAADQADAANCSEDFHDDDKVEQSSNQDVARQTQTKETDTASKAVPTAVNVDRLSAEEESNTMTLVPLKEKDANVTATAKPDTLEPSKAQKSASSQLGSSQPGKVLYRVGLSKKSRIAPLLKIIKK